MRGAKTTSARAGWMGPAGLIVMSLAPALGGAVRLADTVGSSAITPENARFMAMPLPIVLHILSALPFSIVGALQFSPSFRRGNRGWHRAAGRALVVLGATTAISGLWMTLTYPWANNDGEAVYFARLLAGCGMAVSIALGVEAIRRRDFVRHGEWMTRGYALGLGAGTQVFTHLPWFILVDMHPGELPRAVMMAAGWVINAAAAEWIIRAARARRTSRGAAVRVARAIAAEPAHAG